MQSISALCKYLGVKSLIIRGLTMCSRKNVKIFAKKSAEKFGGKEKSRTFATRLRKNGKFIDKFEKR